MYPRARNMVLAAAILIAGSANAQSSINADGLIESQSGFKFPDATVQTSAAVGAARVVTVSSFGADFTSVAAALDSIGDAAEGNQYLVIVGPGDYAETDLGVVGSWVHLRGAGRGITRILTSRSDSAAGSDAAALSLEDRGSISDLSVINSGIANDWAIGIYSLGATFETTIERVVVEVDGAGGTDHAAVYLDDSEPTIRDSLLKAGGAIGFGTAVNAGLRVVNLAAGFPRPLIIDSELWGGSATTPTSCTDPSGTGYGMHLTSASPNVRGGRICGGRRGVAVFTNGNVVLTDVLAGTSSIAASYVAEVAASGSVKFVRSSLNFLNNSFNVTGTASAVKCVLSASFGTGEVLEDDCDLPP